MIAYRIVAVPERHARATALAELVGGQVVLDEHHDGTFPTHLRALQSAGEASHIVVLEDDAIACPDFAEHVEDLVRQRPTHLLGLYIGRSHPARPQELLAELTSAAPAWLDDPRITDRLRWAVGYVMPTRDIPDVLAALDGPQHAWLNTDVRLGRWHAARAALSYPFPSPVDHDDSIPSTTTRCRSNRVAWQHCREVQHG